MSGAATRAGAIYAPQHMNVSGGNVNIKESTAWKLAGRGSGSFLGPGTRDEGSPPKSGTESPQADCWLWKPDTPTTCLSKGYPVSARASPFCICFQSGAATRAGAIYAGSMAISGGNVTIQKSTAKESHGGKGGGGVRVAFLVLKHGTEACMIKQLDKSKGFTPSPSLFASVGSCFPSFLRPRNSLKLLAAQKLP